MGDDSIADKIKLLVQLKKQISSYVAMDLWTPTMGCMLLAGLHPEPDCTEIPSHSALSFDGKKMGPSSISFYEARLILSRWRQWVDEEGVDLKSIPPHDFFSWCLEDGFKEKYCLHSDFLWVDVFRELFGVVNKYSLMELAEHAEALTAPLDVVLDKLKEIEVKLQSRGVNAIVVEDLDSKGATIKLKPIQRIFTTEELALALKVEPESIRKSLSKNGHYCGVVPNKLPNRRLAWPINAVEKIMEKK